jgi:hypothetical protein
MRLIPLARVGNQLYDKKAVPMNDLLISQAATSEASRTHGGKRVPEENRDKCPHPSCNYHLHTGKPESLSLVWLLFIIFCGLLSSQNNFLVPVLGGTKRGTMKNVAS